MLDQVRGCVKDNKPIKEQCVQAIGAYMEGKRDDIARESRVGR
jgi:hypothetical protein